MLKGKNGLKMVFARRSALLEQQLTIIARFNRFQLYVKIDFLLRWTRIGEIYIINILYQRRMIDKRISEK